MHSELYHHGVKGMKWGVRRYRNADGTLTPAGKRRVNNIENAGRQFKGQVIQGTARAVVGKATGVDKRKDSAKDIAKTILKGAAISAATTLVAGAMTISVNESIAWATPKAKSIGRKALGVMHDYSIRDVYDIMYAKKLGLY